MNNISLRPVLDNHSQRPFEVAIKKELVISDSKKLRIAIVSPFPPSKGTLNEYAFHLVEQMKQKNEVSEIIIITDKLPENNSYPTPSSDKVSIRDVWSFDSMSTLFDIRKVLNETKPDVVFYNIQFLSFGAKKIPATLGLLAPLMSKMAGIPSMVMLHNITETVDYESAGITSNPILKKFYNFSGTILTKIILAADLVTLTIPKFVKIIEDKYKVSNVALVPHGSFETPETPNFEMGEKVKKIMTFGKFGTYKKVEEMIEAVNMVRMRTGEDIEIVIAGTDNPNVPGYLDNVKEKYKHIPNITFTGYVEEEDVPGIFTDCTAVVFPYTSTTGSSGVLHQAGSYGKAVVLPIIGDLKELIEEEGYVGEYFKPGDVQGLAEAIEKLVVDKEHRVALAKQNFAASASLPMSDIMEWYLMHFKSMMKQDQVEV